MPTLLSWKQSVFVTDLKGELYELTALKRVFFSDLTGEPLQYLIRSHF